MKLQKIEKLEKKLPNQTISIRVRSPRWFESNDWTLETEQKIGEKSK